MMTISHFTTDPTIALEVVLQEGGSKQAATRLAQHLGLPLVTSNSETSSHSEISQESLCSNTPESGRNHDPEALQLRFSEKGLALGKGKMELLFDFDDMLKRIKPGKLQSELLVRAAKIKRHTSAEQPLIAIDTTAGLGQDSFLLAAAGFTVTLYERDPIIAALLGDALERAHAHDDLAEIVARMTLVEGDSITNLTDHAQSQSDKRPDVVYLDPMFPKRNKSAAVKKKFQLLHYLEKPCQDAKALLEAAMKANPHKIVIKRPLKGPLLANAKPSYSLKGKTIRYDCIVLP